MPYDVSLGVKTEDLGVPLGRLEIGQIGVIVSNDTGGSWQTGDVVIRATNGEAVCPRNSTWSDCTGIRVRPLRRGESVTFTAR